MTSGLAMPAGYSPDGSAPALAGATMATKPMDVRDSGPVMSVVFFTSRFVHVVDEALRDAAAAGGWYGARGTALSSIFGNGSPYAKSTWRRAWGGLWDHGRT